MIVKYGSRLPPPPILTLSRAGGSGWTNTGLTTSEVTRHNYFHYFRSTDVYPKILTARPFQTHPPVSIAFIRARFVAGVDHLAAPALVTRRTAAVERPVGDAETRPAVRTRRVAVAQAGPRRPELDLRGDDLLRAVPVHTVLWITEF